MKQREQKKFLTRLEDYFVDVSKVLRGESDKSAIFPNPVDVGDTREDIFAQVLKDHLPANCVVGKGGFLFNLEGEESKQIDILINSAQSLQFNFDPSGTKKTFSCIDGCLGVVSVKSNLTRDNLIDALNNLASIPAKSDIAKRINPSFTINNYADWPYKVIFAPKGSSCSLIMEVLAEYYEAHPEVPDFLRPNLIYVVGSYVIQNTGYSLGQTRDGDSMPPYTFNPVNSATVADTLALPEIISELQGRASAANQVVFIYDELVDKLLRERSQ